MGMDIRQTYCPSRHKGALGGGGFRGVNNSKVLRSCPIGTHFGSCLRIHLGMDIGYIQVGPQYPRGHFGSGGLGGHKFKSGKAAKRMDRLAPISVHVCGLIWEWI